MISLKNFRKRPNALAPFEDKLTPEYGKQIAEFISREWFNGKMISNGCEFMGRYNYVENSRLYSRGEQDTQQYKNVLARQKGDLTYLNLDWRIVNYAGKFVNIVANGISEDNYRMSVRAIDRYSLMDKKKKLLEHKVNMRALPMLQKSKQLLGIDMIPGFVPEDDDELMFHTEIKDRPKIEIAEELTTGYIKSINNWKNIKDQCDKDLVECGLMAAQIYTDPINGVSIRYVDPAEAVHSFVRKNDFSDAYYFGFVDSITLSDIKRESGFDDGVLRQIAQSYKTDDYTVDYMQCPIDDIIDIKVNVLRFAWKTSKSIVYKKYLKDGGDKAYKVAKRSDKWEVPEEGQKSRMSKTYDTWLEGTYVIGSRDIYGYKECENIIFDEMNNARPPFIFRASDIHKNRLKSFLSDIKKSCDEMQYTHLKIQHLKAELKPDMIAIDLDGLADLVGDTKAENWKQILSILNVKGVVFTKRIDLGEGNFKDVAAAKPIAVQQGSALAELLNVWAHEYNAIRELTGINPARDGSLPADALLGVNRMAQLASNTVTKHIVDAAVDFDKRVCETISARVKCISKYKEGKTIMDRYKQAVGKQNIEAMEAMETRDLHDFGFITEMVPSTEEIKDFKEDLAISLKEGSIDVEDKIEAQELAKVNLKQANEYIKYARKRRIKQKAAEEEQRSRLQTESNVASLQAASEGRIKEKVAIAQIEVDKETRMSGIRLMELAKSNEINRPEKQLEFEQKVYLEQVENSVQFNTKKYLEDRKDERVDKQSTQQSEMITQRHEETKPLDFENKFDIDNDDV